MAESSRFWQTNGTGDGPAGGYSQAEMAEIYRALLVSNLPATQAWGVSSGYLNELAVSGTSSPLTVATGAAHVYGFFYINTTPVTVDVPTPVSATRVDRIVLRADWTTQTVRIARLAGVEGAGAPPAATQTPGDKYEISLASFYVTTGGVIGVTDQRWYLNVVAPGGVGTAKIADSAVTTAKIADNAVTAAKIAPKAVTAAEIADNTITASQIGANAVGASELADNAVDTAAITAKAVTAAKIADATITATQIANDTITATQIAANAVGSSELADNAVDTAAIANLAVTTAKIADNAVTAAKIAANTITAAEIAANAVGASELADNAVDTAAMANLAVTTAKIADNNVTTAKIAPKAVTAAEIADSTITAMQLANSAVANAKLADDAVTRAKLHPTSFMPVYMARVSTSSVVGQLATQLSLVSVHTANADGVFSVVGGGVRFAVAGAYLINWSIEVLLTKKRTIDLWLATEGGEIAYTLRSVAGEYDSYEGGIFSVPRIVSGTLVYTAAANATLSVWLQNKLMGTPFDSPTIPQNSAISFVLIAQT